MTRPRHERGFSLIEVMIAMIVLALGLLGILAVIINSLKLSSSSNYRTIASAQASSIAETLRASPATIASTVGGSKSFDNPVPAAKVIVECLNATGCGRDDYVQNQALVWQQQLAVALPGGAGFVCRDSAPASHPPKEKDGAVDSWECDGAGQYVVKICWNESRVAASAPSLTGGLLCTWNGI